MRRWHTAFTAVLLLSGGTAYAGDHVTWPADWNNWNDPALWVTVGNPGNDASTDYGFGRFGAVNHTYKISTFEVTAGQYTTFLNAVAKTDTYGLYNPSMWSEAYGCKIQQFGSSGNYTYEVASDYANRPVDYVSWGDAARYANWLQNGQPTGAQGLATTEDGSYYLNGATSAEALMAVTRKGGARYVLPTEDEWYKAAYHKNDGVTGNYWRYPTRSDSAPGRDMSEGTNPGNNANYSGDPFPIDDPYYSTVAGEFQLSVGPYGTFDQGGNVWEWNETAIDGSWRGTRGGQFDTSVVKMDATSWESRGCNSPTIESWGFSVAAVPEPSTFALLAAAAVGLAAYAWRRRRAV